MSLSKQISTKWWLRLAAIFIMGGAILLFNVNSYGADKNHTNGLFLWTGIISILIGVFCGIEAAVKGGTPKAQ